jgi:type 1 glutamine amidotransferase
MRLKKILFPMFAAACACGLAFPVGSFAEQGKTPKEDDVKKVEAALPEKASVAPKKAHKVLVFGRAAGFVHSSIPLGCKAVELLGKKTGAYEATTSYDPADFTADNLKQYDAIVLVSTTGEFLDDKNDKPATEARRSALLSFVKEGKGVAGIHAASDAYYSWPEYGDMIGGYFNGHPWGNDTVKIDDPKSPITAAFDGKEFEIQDETYTFKKEPWSREKLHILTSLDVAKFSPGDLKGENRPYDHDYGISWIHNFGKGRVFYCAHGHSEHVYWNTPMLQEYLAGIQYVLGDLEADATPSTQKTAAAK